MTNQDRSRIRNKQDKLLELAAKRNIPDHYRITTHPGAPTVAQLRDHIWPQWEGDIDQSIRSLT
jgi:hypothetical protein